MIIILSGHVDITQHGPGGPPLADRHARSRLVHGRARPALRPPRARRRARASDAVEAHRHPAGPTARAADRRGRARRAHHARPDPAPRRPHRERRRRPGHRRPRRRRRRAAARATSCARNGHPHQRARSRDGPRGRARWSSASTSRPAELPIVLCPGGQLLRNPTESELARCLGLVSADRSRPRLRRGDRRRRAGRARRRRLRGLRGAVGAGARLPRLRRPGRRLGADRELPRLPDRHQRHGADGARLQPGAEVRRRDGHPGRGAAASRSRSRRRQRSSCWRSPTTSASARAPS